MGDDDDGDAPLAVERLQRLHDLMRIAGIEISGRLVCKQQDRIVDQGAGDRDALLLAARQLPRRVSLAISQTQEFQRCPCPFGTLGSARRPCCRIKQGQGDVLYCAGAGEKVKTLKDKAQPFAADARQFRLHQPRNIDPFQIVFPARRPIETSEQRHQRRLPRAGRSHDGNKLAGLDHQVDAA
jgi:hypothetical protein